MDGRLKPAAHLTQICAAHCLLLGLTLALAPTSARAQTPVAVPAAREHPLFLPYVGTLAAEPCGPAVPETCPGGEGWTAVCGGMGRIRDLFALGDGEGTVIAVGDGVARWRPDRGALGAAGAGRGGRAGWVPQIGQELTGLNAAYVETGSGGAVGWAAGDQGQTPELRAGCWRAHPLQHRYVDVELLSIRIIPYNGVPVGWAVGRSGSDLAVVHQLTPAGWQDHSDVAKLAPLLTDVAFDPHPDAFGEMPRAWAVGSNLERREGVFLRTGRDSTWSIRQTDGSGWPRELIFGRDNSEGWAFGERWDGSAVLGWVWDAEAEAWGLDEQSPAKDWAGHALVDAYQVPGTEIWVGVSPLPGRAVLHQRDGDTGEWTAYGPSPYAEDDLGIDGSSAIAAVPAGEAGMQGPGAGVLYAWGEQVWWFDRASEAWTRVSERHRFVDFVPQAGFGWLLASSDQGAGLFTRLGDQLFQALPLDADLDPALAAAPMRALASGGGDTWVVGERGVSLRLRGPLDRPRAFQLPEAGQPRFVDVTVSPAGMAWAISENDTGRRQVWWFDQAAGAWREQALGPQAGAGHWNALTATAQGDVWVVGDRASLLISAACGGARPACWCDTGGTGRQVCSLANSPITPDAIAVSALDNGSVWVAGAQGVARNDGLGWCPVPALTGRSGENLLRSGAQLVNLAVAAPDDIWVVARCGRERRFSDRIACGDGQPMMSTVLHFDGQAWSEATTVNVAIHDIDVASALDGRRTVWLTGDWSTLIRYGYDPARLPPAELGAPAMPR